MSAGIAGSLVDVAALDLGPADLPFSVEYVREDGTERRVPLAVCCRDQMESDYELRPVWLNLVHGSMLLLASR